MKDYDVRVHLHCFQLEKCMGDTLVMTDRRYEKDFMSFLAHSMFLILFVIPSCLVNKCINPNLEDNRKGRDL